MNRAADELLAARQVGSVDLGGVRLETARDASTLLVCCAGLVPAGSWSYDAYVGDYGRPVHRLLLCDRTNRWYAAGVPGHTASLFETVALVGAVAARLEARQVVAVGTSMGGYLALMLGGLLPIAAGVAFSPQTNLDPDWRRRHCDERWGAEIDAANASSPGPGGQDVRAQLLLAQQAGRRGSLHLLFGTDDQHDAAHARHVADLPGVNLYPVATHDHVLSRFLKSRDALVPVIRGAMDGAIPAALLDSLRAMPGDPEYHFWTARAGRAAGALDDAIAAFRAQVAEDGALAHYHAELADALGARGEPDAAVAALRHGLTILPRAPELHYALGVTLRHLAAFPAAEAALRTALDLLPDAENIRHELALAVARRRDKQ